MTNIEIEDVLSSIRRLVSEEIRPLQRPGGPDARLVLTPADRVPPSDKTSATVPATPSEAPAEPEEVSAAPETLEARIAELEAMLNSRRDSFEADEGDRFPEEGAAMVWPVRSPGLDEIEDAIELGRDEAQDDDARAVPEEAGAAPHEPASQPVEEGLFDGSEDMIDEEMLRDLVREILREELQGALGERITRNVRKLVRTEINRALSARDFE